MEKNTNEVKEFMAELRFKYLLLTKFLKDKNAWVAYCDNLKKYPNFVSADDEGNVDTRPEAVTLYDAVMSGAIMETEMFIDIFLAFEWEKTPEKFKYWDDLNNEFNEILEPALEKYHQHMAKAKVATKV